ncbi:MAG: S24 family peptidase [Jiangellaceae bacterium]
MPRIGFALVTGRSMEPVLNDGDRLLVMWGARPRPGRVVVIRLPGRPGFAVKRIGWRDGDGWWVERDNPLEGVDSWQVGAVASADVVAVALVRLWPRPRRLTGARHRRTGG